MHVEMYEQEQEQEQAQDKYQYHHQNDRMQVMIVMAYYHVFCLMAVVIIVNASEDGVSRFLKCQIKNFGPVGLKKSSATLRRPAMPGQNRD